MVGSAALHKQTLAFPVSILQTGQQRKRGVLEELRNFAKSQEKVSNMARSCLRRLCKKPAKEAVNLLSEFI